MKISGKHRLIIKSMVEIENVTMILEQKNFDAITMCFLILICNFYFSGAVPYSGYDGAGLCYDI